MVQARYGAVWGSVNVSLAHASVDVRPEGTNGT